ncbi:hypothetical protein WMY93_030045 [Mugilogobius chulae]|uniref:Protein arginine N-methyltransferase 6 n=1 Tax=Mugilogobius chulae TaxID=88201 RepID=A0AAW0MSX6_9GOBI
MSCMHDFAKKCIMNSDITVTPVTVEDVLSHPARFAELDLNTVTTEQLREVKGQFRCSSFGCAAVNAFCVWFTVTFPCPEKQQQPVILSTSPFKPETHWKQAVLYLTVPWMWEGDRHRGQNKRRCPENRNVKLRQIEATAPNHTQACTATPLLLNAKLIVIHS